MPTTTSRPPSDRGCLELRQEPRWEKLVLALVAVGVAALLVAAASEAVAAVIVAALWSAMFAAGYLDQRLYRVTIDGTRVRFGGLVLRRTIPRTELRSYRVVHASILGMRIPYYELFDHRGRARGRISGALRDVARLEAWLKEHLNYEGPDAVPVVSDPRGVRLVNGLAGGVLLAAAALMAPAAYVTRYGQAAGLLALVVTFIGGGVLAIRRRIEPEGYDPVVYLTTAVLGLRALFNGAVFDHLAILEIGLALALGAMALLQPIVARRRTRGERVAMRGFVLATGLALAYCANEQLDFRATTPHPTTVLEKTVSRGSKSTTYYVTVRSWRASLGPTTKLSVPKTQYDRAEAGQAAVVHTGRGFLAVEWAAGLGL